MTMKKIFTILFAGLALQQVQSQTITSANLPVLGEAWIEFIDTTGSLVTITPGGAGQTWNYGTSFNVGDTSGFIFESPSTAPAYMNASTNFPGATLVVNNTNPLDSNATFIKTNATGLYFDGIYKQGAIVDTSIGLNISVLDYNPDRLLIPVPFALNDTRANNAKLQIQFTVNPGPPVGLVTVNVHNYYIQDFVADATGTLTTPLGTFNNVLRIKEYTYQIDSTIYSVPLIPTDVNIHDTTISYQFVQANSHCLLMSASVDPITLQTNKASYYDPIVLVGAEEDNTLPVSMYPNPAGDEFYLNHIRSNSTIQIFNIAGKLVKDQYLGGLESNIKVNTTDMSAGFYFFSISNSENGNYFKGKFEVVK
jgi:hypothetical protein